MKPTYLPFTNIKYSMLSRGTIFDRKERKVRANFTYQNKVYHKDIDFKPNSKTNDRDIYYFREADKVIKKQIKTGSLLKFVNVSKKDKKTNLLFNLITSGITFVVAILGVLLLTDHLGNADALYRVLHVAGNVEKMPPIFGSMHLISLAIMLVVAFLLIFFLRKKGELTFRIIFYVSFITMVILELIKQFIAAHDIVNDQVIYRYNWSQFPFQLCSAPYFIFPFVIYLKNGKLRDAFLLFVATFILIGGLAGAIYPSFSYTTFINYHTLFHHELMIVLAIFTAVYYRNKLNLQNALLSVAPFLVMLVIAFILNEVVWLNIPAVHSGDMVFNMFWISPHFNSVLPIFDVIQPVVPYPVFALIYALSCLLGIYVVLVISSLIIRHKIKPCITLKAV